MYAGDGCTDTMADGAGLEVVAKARPPRDPSLRAVDTWASRETKGEGDTNGALMLHVATCCTAPAEPSENRIQRRRPCGDRQTEFRNPSRHPNLGIQLQHRAFS